MHDKCQEMKGWAVCWLGIDEAIYICQNKHRFRHMYMCKVVIAFCRWYGRSFSWHRAVQVVSGGTWCTTTTGSFMPWCKRSKYNVFCRCSNRQNSFCGPFDPKMLHYLYNHKPNFTLELYCCNHIWGRQKLCEYLSIKMF